MRLIKKFMITTITLLVFTACAEQKATGDIEKGKSKSKTMLCMQCHGANGISIVPIYPNLAGQKEQYLQIALQAYRAGERVNMAMTPHAKKLTDEDIADLAAYYASLPADGN